MNVSTRVSNRAWVEVDLGGLLANARSIQSAAPGAQLLPMVKANAYGLGVHRVVGALDALNPWGWGVATVEEGVELRDAGSTRPVVVFTPARLEQFSGLRQYELRPVLDRRETIEAWGTYNSVWRLNADGDWLVVFDAGSFPDETPTEEQRKLLESDSGCE